MSEEAAPPPMDTAPPLEPPEAGAGADDPEEVRNSPARRERAPSARRDAPRELVACSRARGPP